ncbi:MAG: cytochrome d ubiquinol oxidase subunit II, partial [Kutzneria sp.]|nr:cytochrome d ubiquinol oxidase subunit II [Kutzneria sp.]
MLRARAGRDGQAFVLFGVLLAGTMTLLFGSEFPTIVTSTIDSAFSLTVRNSSSSPYTLGVITWLAAFCAPIVLAYQSWSYWVFRRRIGTRHIPEAHVP